MGNSDDLLFDSKNVTKITLVVILIVLTVLNLFNVLKYEMLLSIIPFMFAPIVWILFDIEKRTKKLNANIETNKLEIQEIRALVDRRINELDCNIQEKQKEVSTHFDNYLGKIKDAFVEVQLSRVFKPFDEYSKDIKSSLATAEKVWLLSRTGRGWFKDYRQGREMKAILSKDSDNRLIFLNPSNGALKMHCEVSTDAPWFVSPILNTVAIRSGCSELYNGLLSERDKGAFHFDIKVTDYLTSFNLLIINPESEEQDSIIYLELNRFGSGSVKRPVSKITYGDKYFEVFLNEFKEIWKKGKPYKPLQFGDVEFHPTSILNRKFLIASLKNPDTNIESDNKQSQKFLSNKDEIRKHLDPKAIGIIDKYDGKSEVTEDEISAIINSLNQILNKTDFYNTKLFGNLNNILEEDAQAILNKGGSINNFETKLMNRRILEAIYPDAIAKFIPDYNNSESNKTPV